MREPRINQERLAEFVALLLQILSGERSRAALWFYLPVDLPLMTEPIAGPSPFVDSSSVLAGHGYLVSLNPDAAQALADFFARDMDALSAFTHLEIEVRGELAFRAYDHFTVILPGKVFDDDWFNELAQQGFLSWQ